MNVERTDAPPRSRNVCERVTSAVDYRYNVRLRGGCFVRYERKGDLLRRRRFFKPSKACSSRSLTRVSERANELGTHKTRTKRNGSEDDVGATAKTAIRWAVEQLGTPPTSRASK
jgi:hypothetical protein